MLDLPPGSQRGRGGLVASRTDDAQPASKGKLFGADLKHMAATGWRRLHFLASKGPGREPPPNFSFRTLRKQPG